MDLQRTLLLSASIHLPRANQQLWTRSPQAMSQPEREKEAFFSPGRSSRMRSSARLFSTRDYEDNTPVHQRATDLAKIHYMIPAFIVAESNFQQGMLQQMLLLC
jgi:hypothetical protein